MFTNTLRDGRVNDGSLDENKMVGNSPAVSLSCDTSLNPAVTLALNRTTGLYHEVKDNFTAVGNVTTEDGFPGATSADTTDYIQGRLCDCSPEPGTYCPDGIPMCNLTISNDTIVKIQCSEEHQSPVVRLVFRVSIAIFVFAILFCIFSRMGRNCFIYTRKVLCRWSEQRYEQALNEEVDQMLRDARMQRRAIEIIRQRRLRNELHIVGLGYLAQAQGDTFFGEQTAVALKTQIFKPNDRSKDSDLECSICLQEIKRGQRIGKIPCGHLFHVGCLKPWIRRRNCCPLCKERNVAGRISGMRCTGVSLATP